MIKQQIEMLQIETPQLHRKHDKEMNTKKSLLIIDVIEKPNVAYEAKVMMTPTLVKTYPPPVKSMIGNFSNGHFIKML